MAAGLLRYGTGTLKAALEDKMGLDRRQFFKTIAAGAVAASLPTVVVAIAPKTNPNKLEKTKFANFLKAVMTQDPEDILVCFIDGTEMVQMTDGGFEMITDYSNISDYSGLQFLPNDIIVDFEGSIRG